MLEPQPIEAHQETHKSEDIFSAAQDNVDWIQALEEAQWACEGYLLARQEGY